MQDSPRVLVLGSGMVVPPVVKYLSTESKLNPTLTIGTVDTESSQKFQTNPDRVKTIYLDVTDDSALEDAVMKHDLVISLVPWPLHPGIASCCIRNRVDMVTTSYVSDTMQSMHDSAKKAGITILNECGLDPGIDHLGAMKIIDDVKQRGGKIKSFVSYCGGLPAAEDSFVPLQYKFSWSPRGVFAAGLSQATYKVDGKINTTDPEKLFNYSRPVNMFPSLNLEGYPNRNSLIYEDAYGIQGCETILRGTLRYRGFCLAMRALQSLGLFSEESQQELQPEAEMLTWRDLMSNVLKIEAESVVPNLMANGFSMDESVDANNVIERLGLFSNEAVPKASTIIDALCERLQIELEYKPGERDMVLLSHQFIAEWNDGTKSRINSTLVKTGNPQGETAMAETVGIPCALGAEMILNKVASGAGVIRPLDRSFYLPLLERLEDYGISMKEEEYRVA